MSHPVLRIAIVVLIAIAFVLAALLGYTGDDEYGLPGRVPGRPATTAPATAPEAGDAGARLGRAAGSPWPAASALRHEPA